MTTQSSHRARGGARAVALLAALLLAGPGAPAEVWLGGDLHLGRGTLAGRGALRALAGAGVGIVNLEGPVAARSEGQAGGRLRLFNHPGSLGELAAAGIGVASIANNHAGDAGPEGPARTMAALWRAGVRPAGGPGGVAMLERDGLRLAVSAHDLSQGVPAGLARVLTRAAAQADVLVSTFHTTGPPSYLPSPALREAAGIAEAAGAVVVAAHGSHQLGPIEFQAGRVRLFGLGNLAFACDCTREDEALVVRLELEPGRVRGLCVVPVRAGLQGRPLRRHEDPRGVFELLQALESRGLAFEQGEIRGRVDPLAGRVVCVDPGHPSETRGGTVGPSGVRENHLNWVVARQLQAAWSARGARVVLTKDREDQRVTNRERAETANRAGAALMLRLHCDAGTHSGYQLFYPDRPGTVAGVTGPSPEILAASGEVAAALYQGMEGELAGHLVGLGVAGDSATFVGGKQGALTGSIFAEVPTVLVEMGVLTNPVDEAFLVSPAGQRRMVEALTRGLERVLAGRPAQTAGPLR